MAQKLEDFPRRHLSGTMYVVQVKVSESTNMQVAVFSVSEIENRKQCLSLGGCTEKNVEKLEKVSVKGPLVDTKTPGVS